MISKYQVIGQIGEGAMGIVYKAHDTVLDRFVALKTISALVGTSDELHSRFKREAQWAGQLNHPNIVTVYDFGEDGGVVYMAMELLDGVDLRNLIQAGYKLSIDQKLWIMEQVCEGLAYAHSRDVVHRDLKPSNIRVLPNGQVKILDFGLARIGSRDMTRSGVVVGTPNYISPEQVQGQHVDSRADIFSLGAVFYELLSGQKPFDADSLQAILFNVVENRRLPLGEVAPDVPKAIVDVVEKSLASDREHRFQTVAEARAELYGAHHNLVATTSDQTLFGFQLSSPFDLQPIPNAPAWPAEPLEPSHAFPVASQAPSRARMRALGWLALTLVVTCGGVTWLLFARVGEAERRASLLTETVVAAQLDLSIEKLAGKRYREAVACADRVLELDPRNQRAQETRSKAREALLELDRSAERARKAWQGGSSDEAAAALAAVASLDPAHPLIGELSDKVEGYLRGKAEAARRAMMRSQKAAERYRGQRDFETARELARDGEALLKNGQFAPAAEKLMLAREKFDQLRRGSGALTPSASESGSERSPQPIAGRGAAATGTQDRSPELTATGWALSQRRWRPTT